MKSEVAKTATALVDASEFDDMTGAGLQNARQEEMKRSILNLLQQSSGAATRGSEQYVTGAQAGMFLSSGSGQIFEKVEFVPVARDMKFLEWIPLQDEQGRPQDGGFRGEHDPDSDFVRRLRTPEYRFKKIPVPENGTELVQTMGIWALIGAPNFTMETAELVNIPFTSIKIKHYTDWYDRARRLRYPRSDGSFVVPDIWCHRWMLTAEFEQKWPPNGAWNVRIALAKPTKEESFLKAIDPLRQEAQKLAAMVESGAIKADYEQAREEGGTPAAAAREAGDDEVPF